MIYQEGKKQHKGNSITEHALNLTFIKPDFVMWESKSAQVTI